MSKIKKYNLEIMTLIFAIVVIISIMNWSGLSFIQRMTIGYIVLYTLHEWEESRFPGGFYQIFFKQFKIDWSIGEENMHFPVAVYLLIISILPMMFDKIIVLAFIPLMIAFFEGIIHTVGVILHQLKKPYTPGMITAWIMFVYSIIMVTKLNEQYEIGLFTWLLGIVLTVASFACMESRFLNTVGITMSQFRNTMKDYVLGRIKKSK